MEFLAEYGTNVPNICSLFHRGKLNLRRNPQYSITNTWHLSTARKSQARPPVCWEDFEVSCSEDKMEQLSLRSRAPPLCSSCSWQLPRAAPGPSTAHGVHSHPLNQLFTVALSATCKRQRHGECLGREPGAPWFSALEEPESVEWLPLGEQDDSRRHPPPRAGGARRRRAGRGSFLVRSLSTTAPRGGHSGPSARPVSCLMQSRQPLALAGFPNRGDARRPRGGWGLGAPGWEPQAGGRRNRGWTAPPGSGKPALWCDAATRAHLRSRACCTRAAPGGKRGEVGTWARGSRGAGASEALPERRSLFGVCRGWGLRAGTARRTSQCPRTAGGRECGAERPRAPLDARDRVARPERTGTRSRRGTALLGRGAAWLGRRDRADPERLPFEGAVLLGRDRELSISAGGSAPAPGDVSGSAAR